MKLTHEEIILKVKYCISQVLMGMDISEINYDDSLINDLGLDSLDFVDLMFRLDTTFGIKIQRGQIEVGARERSPDQSFEKDGIVTSQGLLALQYMMPEVPTERFTENLKVADIPSLLTVGTFVKIVEYTLAFQEVSPESNKENS